MRNLDITDTREKLKIYAQSGLISPTATSSMPELAAARKPDTE